MIILLLFFYSFSGHTINGVSIDFKTSKQVMCGFYGNKLFSTNPLTPLVDPSTIPKECEIIIFQDCNSGNTTSSFSCNTDMLKRVVDLKRPVFLKVRRFFAEWLSILKTDGNADDAKTITDYATANGAIGVVIRGFSPESDTDIPDGTLATNVVPYLKQLKCTPDFIVGVSLEANSIGNDLNNPCVFNYEASNDLLDFYVVNTYELNAVCQANVFNGKSPIHKVGNLLCLDEVVAEIKKTKIAADKLYLNIDLEAGDPNATDYTTYSELCSTKHDTSTWCIPTTKDYYDKAKFISENNYGIGVFWIEYDDSLECCCCGSFIGLKNIVAGFKGEKQLSCAKFDIKASP